MITLDIVTITYNSEKFLTRCLDSVRNIRPYILNFIVIDGGSVDGTVRLIQQNLDIINEYVSEPDCGISDAFNKGVSRCEADFILLLNSDDWIATDKLNSILSQINIFDEIVCTKMISYSDDGYIGEFESEPSLIPKYNSMLHPGCIISSGVYRKIGGYNLSFKVGMDYDFFSRCYNAGVMFKKIDLPLVGFYEGGTSRKRKYLILKESFNLRRIHHGAEIPLHEIKQFISRYIGDALTVIGLKRFVKSFLERK